MFQKGGHFYGILQVCWGVKPGTIYRVWNVNCLIWRALGVPEIGHLYGFCRFVEVGVR